MDVPVDRLAVSHNASSTLHRTRGILELIDTYAISLDTRFMKPSKLLGNGMVQKKLWLSTSTQLARRIGL